MNICSLDNISKHKGLHCSADIRKLCVPLEEAFGINYFHYFKAYDNNKCISLSTHPHWIEHRFKYQKGVLRFPSERKSYQVIWDNLPLEKRQVFIDAEKYYNIFHGLTIIKRIKNEYEFFHFAISSDNFFINDFYVNEQNIFKHFINYFKSNAASLIKDAESNPIELNSGNGSKLFLENAAENDKKKDFINKTNFTKVAVTIAEKKTIYLTFQEYQISVKVLQHMTAKQIAKELNISHRTVESHINHTYEKIGVRCRHELMNVFLINNLI